MSKLTLVTNSDNDSPDPEGPAGVPIPMRGSNDRATYILTCLASSLLVNVVLVDHVDYYGQKANGTYQVAKGRPVIYLDKHLKGHELNRVLAHELAHVLLHTGMIGPRYRNDLAYHAEIEAEADEYVEKLLSSIEGGKLRLPEIKSVAQEVELC